MPLSPYPFVMPVFYMFLQIMLLQYIDRLIKKSLKNNYIIVFFVCVFLYSVNTFFCDITKHSFFFKFGVNFSCYFRIWNRKGQANTSSWRIKLLAYIYRSNVTIVLNILPSMYLHFIKMNIIAIKSILYEHSLLIYL